MSAPHPTRIVRLQLIGTLLGVSIPFAIEGLVDQKYPLPMFLATFAFLLTSLNFFHGKVVTLEDEDYNNALTDRPRLALIDYVLNLTVVLSFVFMAFCLDKPRALIGANLVVRIFDILLVLLIMKVALDPEVLKANKFWLQFNIAAIVTFLAVGFSFYGTSRYQLVVSATFLAVIVTDIVLDYWKNHAFFFSMADKWDDMAGFWNAMQGEKGDIFRRNVITPALLSTLTPDRDPDPAKRRTEAQSLAGMQILDLGCGNGCIARALAAAGARVTAIDKSEAQLNIARSYDVTNIDYQMRDLDRAMAVQFKREKFDAVVAVFTLQDCKDLCRPLEVIAANLKPGGRLVIIRDNDEAFENLSEHSTARRWLGSEKDNGRGRRQLVFWRPEAIRIGRGGTLGSQDDEIAREWTTEYRTITRYWNDQSYIDAAAKVGLQHATSEAQLQVDPNAEVPQTLHLARYAKRPRLGMLVFVKI